MSHHPRRAASGSSLTSAASVDNVSGYSVSATSSTLGGAFDLVTVGSASGLLLVVLLRLIGSAALNSSSPDIP